MPLTPGNSKPIISNNIREFHTGKTFAHTAAKFGKKRADKQAIAVALSTARRSAKKYAQGGDVNGATDDMITPDSLPGVPDALRNAASDIASPIANMVMAPGKTLTQKPQTPGQWSDLDEATSQINTKAAPAWGINTAGTLAGVGAPAAEEGAAGIFGGDIAAYNLAKRGSPEPLAALKKAQTMESDGHAVDVAAQAGTSLLKDTPYGGVSKGADGKWRFEISDDSAKLNPNLERGMTDENYVQPTSLLGYHKMGDIVNHPELYKAYPEIADMPVRSTGFNFGTLGWYNPTDQSFALATGKERDVLSTALHEMQHKVQNTEGFKPGANTKMFEPPDWAETKEQYNNVSNQIDTILERAGYMGPDKYKALSAAEETLKTLDATTPVTNNWNQRYYGRVINQLDKAGILPYLQEFTKLRADIRNTEKKIYDSYSRAMGEVESRNVQRRMSAGSAERREVPPIYTEDIPRDKQIDPTMKQNQGGAVARAKMGYASGGSLNAPWYERNAARDIFHEGLIHSSVPGRTDKINMNVAKGAYVVPADVVSGMGQGNTMAGGKQMSSMFKTNPLTMASRFKPPPPPMAPKMPKGLARGGHAETVPIIAAGGEYVIHPTSLIRKYGNLDKGHAEMDKFVVDKRKQHKKTLGKLPGPKK
jgi:hypothetical protein